jgi:hypothetical protein
MPKTPKSAKRPADVISNAVHVMRIATGEAEDALMDENRSAQAAALGRKGGAARAKALAKADRVRIARKAAKALWRSRKKRP